MAFEGCDGAGKTSTLAEVKKQLHGFGPLVSYAVPGETYMGRVVRSAIHQSEVLGGPHVELLAMITAWVDLWSQKVLPDLAEGKLVLLDRAVPVSAMFYQGALRGIAPATILEAYYHIMKGTDLMYTAWPEACKEFSTTPLASDLLVFCEASAETMERRAVAKRGKGVKDVMESKLDVFRKGEEAYRKIADNFHDTLRVTTDDPQRDIITNGESVIQDLLTRFPERPVIQALNSWLKSLK